MTTKAVAVKGKKEVASAPSQESLDLLKQSFPQEAGFNRVQLPRFGMVSQDQMEGVGKNKHVVTEAGAYFTERQSDELDNDGKKVFERVYIDGNTVDAVILFQRKQLSYYDEANEAYVSSPIFDKDDEVIPLFKDRKEIDRGTPAELKSRPEYQYVKEGKTRSSLETRKVLYVLYNGEIHQMTIRGTSMYAFSTFARSVPVIPAVLITMGSEAKVNGQTEWSQMTFKIARALDADEVNEVLAHIASIVDGIKAEKEFYASLGTDTAENVAANKAFDGE